MTLQSSPIVLTLVIAAAFAHALLPYSAGVALGASILALGLTNGSNAGQAVSEAVVSLHHEGGEKGMTPVRARARPLGDLDRRLPDQRRQGNAGRELHRRAGAARAR